MTVHQAIRRAAQQIARRDAETLLLHILRRDRAWLHAHPETGLEAAQIAGFFTLVERRRNHTPLQYLTGRQEFFGLDLQLSPDVLIPRPETEILVEAVLDWARQEPPPLRIADVGTGSGAIALALAAHLPQAHLFALDLSPPVRPVVELNASRLGLAGRIDFLDSDLLSAMQPQIDAGLRLDAVVSNPPYVAEADAATLQPEVRDFEPHTALFAGPDGLAVYHRLIPQAAAALRPGGLLALEFGFGQQKALQTLLNGLENVQILPDLAGIPRVALAWKP